MKGHEGETLKFIELGARHASLAAPSSPFEQVVAAALDLAMTPDDGTSCSSDQAEPVLRRVCLDIWPEVFIHRWNCRGGNMKRSPVYQQYKRGEITLDDLAGVYGLTRRDMKFRLSRHGEKFGELVSTLDQIEANKMTRNEASEVLGVGVRQVNQLMEKWGVQRPKSEYMIRRIASKVKWEIRKKWAVNYIAGNMPIEEAANAAKLSDRQMRRWVSDLLNKHYGMVFKDLRGLTSLTRRRLADEIETAEGVKLVKQQVV